MGQLTQKEKIFMKIPNITLSLLALCLFCAVGLVSTNPALADDTLNTECGYERRAVDDRMRDVDNAEKGREEVRDRGYASSISTGMYVGMGIGAVTGAAAGSFAGGVGALPGAAKGAVIGGIGGGIGGAITHHQALSAADDAVETAEERLAEAQQDLAVCLLLLPGDPPGKKRRINQRRDD